MLDSEHRCNIPAKIRRKAGKVMTAGESSAFTSDFRDMNTGPHI